MPFVPSHDAQCREAMLRYGQSALRRDIVSSPFSAARCRATPGHRVGASVDSQGGGTCILYWGHNF